MKRFFPFFLGILFAAGLCISEMSRPKKVLAFLDLSGSWDPSLALVMLGASGVYLLNFFLLRLRKEKELLGKLPSSSTIDWPLASGAVLFGIGWGMVGFCPGPALTALASQLPSVFAFVLAMSFGMLLEGFFEASFPRLFSKRRTDEA